MAAMTSFHAVKVTICPGRPLSAVSGYSADNPQRRMGKRKKLRKILHILLINYFLLHA